MFPRTSKILKMVMIYFHIRKYAIMHTRHQNERFVPRRDGSIDNKGKRVSVRKTLIYQGFQHTWV